MTIDIDMESVIRVNECLKEREFVLVFLDTTESKYAFHIQQEKFGLSRSAMIIVRFNPSEYGTGYLMWKDGRKRPIASMDTTGFTAKLYSYGHDFNAATIANVYMELTGREIRNIRFREPDHNTFFSRNRPERDF